nr:HAMP domain-containing sensor histidine kinase [uncultured Chryseobacterium sp.]
MITILVILVFQGYWVVNSFENKRKEFLEQTKFEMTQILFNNMVRRSDADAKKIDSLFGKDKIRFDLYPNLNSKSFVAQTVKKNETKSSKKPSQKKILKIEIKKDTLYKTSPFDMNSKTMDSILYNDIKTSIPELSNEKVVIYHENPTSRRTYPLNQPIKNKNTTGKVTPSNDENTYRIHIDDLPRIIILHKMAGIILFSILYIILFIGTFFILYTTLLLNQKVLKNKEIFTRNMTHELKIPISTLLITAEGLEKHDIATEPEGARKYASIIQKATHQLSFLVDSILQNARAEEAKEDLQITGVNLLALLEEVKEILSSIIDSYQAHIIFQDIHPTMYVSGNIEQLRQVFLNLIDNSLKYSEKKPVVIISAKQIHKKTIILIKDNGIGIPHEYAEEVFEPYFRISNDDIHNVKGFGLGLSFVKKTLKNQGGSIKVLKTNDEGSLIEIKMLSYES